MDVDGTHGEPEPGMLWANESQIAEAVERAWERTPAKELLRGPESLVAAVLLALPDALGASGPIDCITLTEEN